MIEPSPNNELFLICTSVIFCFYFNFGFLQNLPFLCLFRAIDLNNLKHGSLLGKRALLGLDLDYLQ